MTIEMRALKAQMVDLDNRLADLFEARMTLFAQDAALRSQAGLPLEDEEFEQETCERLAAKQGAAAAYLPLFFETLFELGHDYQAYILEK